MKTLFFLFSIALAICTCPKLFGQEENNEVSKQAGKYVGLKIVSLEKYNQRIARQQQHILSKLRKKEQRFAKKLRKHDSAAYAKYSEQSLSYDSINTLSKTDSGTDYNKIAQKKNGKIDSLKKITGFAEKAVGTIPQTEQADDLKQLQGELNYKNHINELISKRTSFLKGLAANNPAFKGIEKQVFYGKSKMKVFKEMENDPTVAEEQALEYLQGTEGFDKYMSGGGAGSANGLSGMDANQMEKMGYQTKQMMQKNLTEKFGSNLGGITDKMSGELKGWQDKQKQLTGSIKDAKKNLSQVKNTDKPSFKVNPMRGMPFCKRLEKQYSWQTRRADGTDKPATFDMSGSLAFKHTPKLIYGVGMIGSLGLGQGWQQIHFSFEGIGLKTFATWEWQYGISAYAGYERLYKRAAFVKNEEPSGDMLPTLHSTHKYSESILVGLNKNYNINTKYKGSLQLLYDIWWQQKGLRSPIVLRFVTVKK